MGFNANYLLTAEYHPQAAKTYLEREADTLKVDDGAVVLLHIPLNFQEWRLLMLVAQL